ncbi:hypothetical protein CQW23_18566 [Capsicum baccatum]|uniref:Uncharacterized protein n=1 Tax=Capsicum baccatum TaxID=33114 RepID=A0A2G2W399_CAPBA|nr:hypothetical protein CQW23_18566 [Capsicum baccatum]
MNVVCANGYRIAKCLKEYFLYRNNYRGALSSALLTKSLYQKIWDDSPYLLKQLPGIGMVTAKKKADPGAFTIPCTVGSLNFAKALCDLGASINLMPLSIYKKLGLGDPTPTNMRLVMDDRSVKRHVGIFNDVLVKVSSFIFPADFVILDCEVASEVPIILGRPFLATGSVLIDMRDNELLFRLNDEVFRFDIYKAMKQPNDMDVFSVAYEDKKALSVKKHLTVEPLVAALLNVEHEDDEDYEELIGALTGIRSYSHTPKQLDPDLTNQPSQTAKTSIVEPPMLESKELPNYRRYTFLGYGNTLSESVADDLSKQHVEALIFALMRYKRAMGRKIDDIIGIPPGICTHKSHLEEDCMPTIKVMMQGKFKEMEVKELKTDAKELEVWLMIFLISHQPCDKLSEITLVVAVLEGLSSQL